MNGDDVFEDSDQHQGRYANYFRVGYNAFEFVLDFGQFFPGVEEARVHSRIIMSPVCAKELLRVAQESIDEYEQTLGSV